MNKQKLSLKRHLLKTVSWRIIGTLDTVILSYFITGNLIFAFEIGGVELFTKMVLYFLHERLWYKIDFGTNRPKKIKINNVK